jgi:pyridoxal phosphate enzyme (YggS family)
VTPIHANIAAVKSEMAQACGRSGRPVDAAQLMIVSKTFPPEVIREAISYPHFLFGENRVQECLEKAPVLPPEVRWHLIGHLQTNKVRKILPLAAAIHSVDSVDLATFINRIAGELGVTVPIYIQVNIADDDAKFGLRVDAVRPALEKILALPQLKIEGLMTIPNLALNPEQARPHFASLRQLRDALEPQFGIVLPGLSMGMSGDFAVAIEEGATIVRVGSRIFGGR